MGSQAHESTVPVPGRYCTVLGRYCTVPGRFMWIDVSQLLERVRSSSTHHFHTEFCARSIGPVYSTIKRVSGALSAKQRVISTKHTWGKITISSLLGNATPRSLSQSQSKLLGAFFETIFSAVEVSLYLLATKESLLASWTTLLSTWFHQFFT